jgi:hypothetical protein
MTFEIIAEHGGKERQHRDSLGKLLATTTGPICIASPYITENELISGLEKHKHGVRVLTSLAKIDIVSNATSLNCLASLVRAGVECRSVSDARLHAKVYLFAAECAVVTSANLTNSGLSTNLEVGVRVTDGSVQKLALWFDALWNNAKQIKSNDISRLLEQTKELRRQFAALRKKAGGQPRRVIETNPNVRSARDLRDLLQEGRPIFVCNTNRRWSPDRKDEQLMRHMRYATVWTEFRWENHIRRVKKGDAILIFAKGVGIIGVGQAKSGVEILEPGKPGRIRTAKDYQTEWRIPVEDWLVWVVDDAEGYEWAMGNTSFLDVSGERYQELRNGVRDQFLGNS